MKYSAAAPGTIVDRAAVVSVVAMRMCTRHYLVDSKVQLAAPGLWWQHRTPAAVQNQAPDYVLLILFYGMVSRVECQMNVRNLLVVWILLCNPGACSSSSVMQEEELHRERVTNKAGSNH
jgi:hypothetical protein